MSLPVLDSAPTRLDRVRITEIFLSLQGESTRMGLPCVMVRLTGCNLRCTWCDTEYAFEGGSTISVDEVVDRVDGFGVRRVEITGGEPLLQKSAPVLAQRLLDLGYEVLCETSGERDIDLMPGGVRRIVDIKCPGSNESERNDWANIERLRATDEVKFVVVDRSDFDWAVAIIREHGLIERCPVHISPVWQSAAPSEVAEWILGSGLDLRLSLQQHKILWGDTPGR